MFFHSKFSLILVPDSVPGQMIHATVVNLNPWVDYEFRVVAINNVGVGEPACHPNPFAPKLQVSVHPSRFHIVISNISGRKKI